MSDTSMKMSLPGRSLAAGWLNTWLSTGTADAVPVLYRTVLVEQFDTGIQLVATDSFMLLGGFIPTAEHDLVPPPARDESPISSHIVIDPDRRMVALMRFVHEDAKAAAKAGLDPHDVTVSTSSAESPSVPTLDPTLDRSMFVVEVNNERLALPIYEGAYPDWRALVGRARTGEATSETSINPMLLGRLGKLRDVATAIRFEFAGQDGLISISAPGDESYLFGGLMPVKFSTEVSA